jgi:diacylglycerol kinase family enzyme
MHTAIVINPSKVADVGRTRAAISTAFSAAGLAEPLWYETTVDDPGSGQARQAIAQDCQVVVACGGDGTVRACAHELAGTDVALAILPTGTGNLLVSNLGLPTDVDDVVAAIAAGSRRRIDLGQVDGAHFTVMTGMGFDAAMIQATPVRLKRRLGWLAYVIGAARSLGDRALRVSLTLDGGRRFDRSARTVLVANVGRLQGGVDLFGDSRPDDGLLDVAVIRARTFADWAVMAVTMIARRRPHRRHLETFRVARVDIRCQTIAPRQIDGDAVEPGRTMSVSVQAAALLLCVPSAPSDVNGANGAHGINGVHSGQT